jgi:predicted regulator of Ras-like GTPase activity (Roadblock/LC7/MglB family)
MAFDKILAGIMASPGVEGVVLLDSEGETIFSLGYLEQERLRLVGAYQGIVLAAAVRFDLSKERTVITLGEKRSILTYHLKDGYFICIIFSKEINVAYAQFRFQEAYTLLKQEL